MVQPDDDVISMSGRSAINHYQKFNIVQPPAAPTPPIKQNQIQEQLAFDLSKIVFSAVFKIIIVNLTAFPLKRQKPPNDQRARMTLTKSDKSAIED